MQFRIAEKQIAGVAATARFAAALAMAMIKTLRFAADLVLNGTAQAAAF